MRNLLLITMVLFSLFGCDSDPVGEGSSTDLPKIVKQPADQTVGIGGTAKFSISASGDSLRYQWMRGKSLIFEAEGSSYEIENVQKSDSGALFRCIVMNPYGVDSSETVELHVSEKNTPPVIRTQPTDQSAIVNGSAVFSLSATGTALEYQWLKNRKVVPGADSSSFHMISVDKADSGTSLQCIVFNSLGADTSETVTLHVVENDGRPVIIKHPEDFSAPQGGVVLFSTTAIGESLYYQWLKDGETITGATSSVYKTIVEEASDSGAAFTCIVYNVHGKDTSSSAVLHVTSKDVPPRIYEQPVDLYTPHGNTGYFYVLANGDNVHFQWFKNGEQLINEISSQIYIPQVHKDDSGAVYHCIAFNMHGADTSEAVQLHVTGEKDPTRIIGGVESSESVPVANALVRLFTREDTTGKAVDSVITDETGAFQFEGMEEGEYHIWVTDGNEMVYYPEAFAREEYTINVGFLNMYPSKTFYIPINIQPNHSLSQFSFNLLGTPVNASVTSDGFLRLDSLVGGNYRIKISSTHSDYVDMIDSLTVWHYEEKDTLYKQAINLIYKGIPIITDFEGVFNQETLEMTLEWDKTDYADIDAYCIFRKSPQESEWSESPYVVIPVTATSHPSLWSELLESKEINYEYRVSIRSTNGDMGGWYTTVSVE